MSSKVELGRQGQEEALRFLLAKGMELVEANYRLRSGEIDLIMKDGAYLVFVEVKYRRSTQYGLPREAVGFRKQEKIRKTATHYIYRHNLHERDFRFDVVEVLGGFVEHIEDAF